MDRRSFLRAMAAGVLGGAIAVRPCSAFADESAPVERPILFTGDIAAQIGLNFARTMYPTLDVEVSRVTPLADTNGRPLGYVVSFSRKEMNCGYVVFDVNVEGLVGEYSIGENIESIDHALLEVQTRSTDPVRMIQISPLRYAFVEPSTGQGVDDRGNSIQFGGTVSPYTPIDSLIRDYDELFRKYTVISMETVEQFSSFDRTYLCELDVSGRYACGVASGFAVCDNYGALRGATMASDFRTLWGYINPNSHPGGWGSTVVTVSAGVKKFCAGRGKTVVAETILSKPAFSKITSCINSGNLISLGLHTDESDHMVTVEGYANVSTGGTRAAGVPMLIIYDGWYSSPKYINYNYAFTDVYAALYKGR